MRLISAICFFMVLFFQATTYAAEVYNEDHLGIMVSPDKTQFVIQLKSNPATGYSWFLREYDNRLIMPVKYQFEAAKNKLVGSPGVAVWTFNVKKSAFVVPQQTVLRFVYARPWEGDDQTKLVAFRVNIVNMATVK